MKTEYDVKMLNLTYNGLWLVVELLRLIRDHGQIDNLQRVSRELLKTMPYTFQMVANEYRDFMGEYYRAQRGDT